jgi:AcrR family transcriptional regulator
MAKGLPRTKASTTSISSTSTTSLHQQQLTKIATENTAASDPVPTLHPFRTEEWIKRLPLTVLGQKIVSATTMEFAAKGVLGARVAEITRQAGTSDPAFYRYFASIKHAALFIMGEYYWTPLNLRLSHYQQISNDAARLFEAVVQSLIQSTADDPTRPWLAESQVFRIVVAEMRNPFLLPEAAWDQGYINFIQKLTGIIELGQQQGVFGGGIPPKVIAQSLVITLHGLLLQKTLEGQSSTDYHAEVTAIAKRLVELKLLTNQSQ